MNSMMNNSSRNSLSSQRAALEAAIKEEDSPPMPSPQNTNRGKLDQKLGDDIKQKMEIDDDDDNNKKNMKCSKSKSKLDDSDDHKTGSKWIDAGEIKKEKGGDDDQQMDIIKREGWSDYDKDNVKREPKMDQDEGGGAVKKIKEEAMSPASSSQDSQALVKPELKLEPVPNTTDKKKKCSKCLYFCL